MYITETFGTDHISDEVTYVLGVLYQMRAKVKATPTLFEDNALMLIDAEIARYEDVMPEIGAA